MQGLVQFGTEEQTVSARELHERLNIKTAFKDWFPRMCDYGFIQGEDFNVLKNERVQIEGNREVRRAVTDAELSLDMAKQICMLQRTPEGKQVRQYLIDLEKAWNTPEQVMARALKLADRQIQSLNKQVELMQPKAEYFDELVDHGLNTNFRDTAKELGVGERVFICWLIDRGFIYRDRSKKIKPSARYCRSGQGLFEVKEWVNGEKVGTQTLITPKGRERFRKAFSASEV